MNLSNNGQSATATTDQTSSHQWGFSQEAGETHFRIIADAAPVLIWRANTDKLCTWFNQVWLDFTGRSMEQEKGNGWAEGVHPHDLAACMDHYIRHFDARQPFRMEYRLQRRDGEYRWILDTGVPLHDEQGRFLGYVGSCIDITDHRQTEIELQRSHADLQRFAEVTAHHLQEPARRMVNYANRLAMQLQGRVNDPEIQLSIDFINQQARRQQNLLRDVERYLAADQPRGEVKNTNVNYIVTHVLRHLSERITKTGAVLNVGNLPVAWIDSPRLSDLFEVILDNALYHGIRSGQGTALRITIDGEQQGALVRYRIGDNGPGIEEEYCERVFRVFERLSSEGTGTGIGLSIGRRIVESCGGKIWIEGSPGGGCCVVFELPAENFNEHRYTVFCHSAR